MNAIEQKRQATLKEEMVKLAEATAEELGAMQGRITRQNEQIASLHRLVKTLQTRADTAEAQVAFLTTDIAAVRLTHELFTTRGWRARFRWIFQGE